MGPQAVMVGQFAHLVLQQPFLCIPSCHLCTEHRLFKNTDKAHFLPPLSLLLKKCPTVSEFIIALHPVLHPIQVNLNTHPWICLHAATPRLWLY